MLNSLLKYANTKNGRTKLKYFILLSILYIKNNY